MILMISVINYIMKSFLLIIILGGFSPVLSAQSNTPKQDELTNPALIIKIKDYQQYIKDFALRHKKEAYVLTLTHLKTDTGEVYVLNAVFEADNIVRSNPSGFSIIDNIPVMINDFNAPHSRRTEVINYLQKTYLPVDSAAIRKKKQQDSVQAKVAHDELPDTVLLGTRKVPKSKIRMFVEHVRTGGETSPKKWTLVFNKQKLLRTIIDQYEMRSQ